MSVEISNSNSHINNDDIRDAKISSEMQRILRASGIESAPMDPSSAKYLRELIAAELEKETAKMDTPANASAAAGREEKNEIKEKNVSQPTKRPDAVAAATTTSSAFVMITPPSTTTTTTASASASETHTSDESRAVEDKPSTAVKEELKQPPNLGNNTMTAPTASSMLRSPIPTLSGTAKKPSSKTATAAASPATPKLDAALGKLATTTATKIPTPVGASTTTQIKKEESDSTEGDHSKPSSSSSLVDSVSSNQQLLAQQEVMNAQAEALKLMADHLRELTSTVHSLQNSVERLQQQQQQQQQQIPPSTPTWGHPNHPATPRAPATPAVNANNNNNNNNQNHAHNIHNNNNHNNDFDLRRAHELAHHVAWRIATFPVRAILFYMKYEYRIWLVLYRLARRDVLNPFREAGMIFQLGFALIIVYGRIAPALEKAVMERKRELQQQDEYDGADGYANDEDDFLQDAEFQIQTIVMAILVGFFYHVGAFGLFYRFFFRDRLHIRIWKDLREGVELTPNYGLDFDREPLATEEDENEGGDNNQNNEENNDNDNNRNDPRAAEQGNNNNNNGNAPRPPIRNFGNHRNEFDNGPLMDLANAIGNGVNDFFMGHARRRRARQEEDAAEQARAQAQEQAGGGEREGDGAGELAGFANEDVGAENANPDHRNPVIGLIWDVLCLFYSFFISILPGWNYEQQLRDIRDENDRRLRARMEREAEALRNYRNQHGEDGDGDGDGDAYSGSESGSESGSDSE